MSTIKVTSEVKKQIALYKCFMLEHEYTVRTTLSYSTYLSRFLRRPIQDKICSLQKNISNFLIQNTDVIR